MIQVTLSRVIMQRIPSPDQDREQTVTFVSTYDDTGVVTRTLTLSWEDFLAYGSPEEITVSIRPGDHLNDSA